MRPMDPYVFHKYISFIVLETSTHVRSEFFVVVLETSTHVRSEFFVVGVFILNV